MKKMPSKAYERLTNEKKKKIIEAAIEEFSVHTLEKASINGIAKRADISRTTLYYYFTDIEDIFNEVINNVMINFKESMNYSVDHKIDIFDGYYDFFKYVLSFKNTKYEGFVRTMFLDMSVKLQSIITEPYINFFISNKGYVKNLEKLDYENRAELMDILYAIFSVLTASINYYYKNNIDFETIDHKIKRVLKLLKYGVIKEEYRKEEIENE